MILPDDLIDAPELSAGQEDRELAPFTIELQQADPPEPLENRVQRDRIDGVLEGGSLVPDLLDVIFERSPIEHHRE